MEPKIEPWIKDAVDQIHSETESASCDGYCESRKTALMKIIAQHAPSSPAAPNVKKEEVCIGDFAVGAIAAPCIATQESVPIVGESILVNCSPAAPTPHMNAAEFYREVWIKENGSDPRGDWPIRMAEAYAASETARADRLQSRLTHISFAITGNDHALIDCTPQEVDQKILHHCEDFSENETARADQLADQVEFLEREIGNFRRNSQYQAKESEAIKADLQRKDAALQTLITAAEDLLRFVTNPQNIPANNLRRHIEKLRAAPEVTTPTTPPMRCLHNVKFNNHCNPCFSASLGLNSRVMPSVAAPEVTPSPRCANPKMVVNVRPTHNVCLNCGKEEKI